MPKEYTQEQLQRLYQKLPPELKEVIFSEGTAKEIESICSENGLEAEKISDVSKYTGYVLLGVLPPDEFQKALEEELKLEPGLAKKIAQEIDLSIFEPVKESLSSLYKKKVSRAKPKKVIPPTEVPPLKEKPPPPKKGPDVYREPIE